MSGSDLLLLELAVLLHCTAAAVHWFCSASSSCGHQLLTAVLSRAPVAGDNKVVQMAVAP